MAIMPVGLKPLNTSNAAVNPATLEGQQRHELHAYAQPVVIVTTTAALASSLISGGIPSWVTGCRIYVGSAGRVAYSTDGTDPAFSSGDVTYGAPLDAYTPGHLIVGAANVAALKLVAETASTKVTIELMG